MKELTIVILSAVASSLFMTLGFLVSKEYFFGVQILGMLAILAWQKESYKN